MEDGYYLCEEDLEYTSNTHEQLEERETEIKFADVNIHPVADKYQTP